MSGGADDLPQSLLHVIVIMFELPLARHIDCIAIRLVVGDTAAVRTYRDKILPHFLYEIVEADVQPAFVGFRVTSFHSTPVPFQNSFIKLSVRIGQCRLVDVEKRAYLPVVYSLVLFSLFYVQFKVSLPADDLFRVVPVDILVPVIEKERYALLVFPNRCAACLGFAVKGEQIGLAPVSVRVQCHEQCVERAGGYAIRVKPRITLPRCVEPVASGVRRFA